MAVPPSTAACACVLLAHHKPGQALRLIDRLAPAPVFLHVDSGAERGVHAALVAGAATRPQVRLLPRHRSAWASWGQVQPALDGLSAARETGAAHVLVLTGQDYPLVDGAAIQSFARAHPDVSFLPHWPLPSPLFGTRGGMERLRYWHRPVRRRRVRVPVRRRLPDGIAFHGGSAYYMLSGRAVDALFAHLGRRPDLARFYRHAWTPDEMFIHTALLNCGDAGEIANENLWLMDWTPGAKHPRTFTAADAPRLLEAAGRPATAGGPARAKLLARKFDADVDAAVLDILDRAA